MKTELTRATETGTRWYLLLLMLFASLFGTAFGQDVTNCECWDGVTNWRGTFTITVHGKADLAGGTSWQRDWQADGSFELWPEGLSATSSAHYEEIIVEPCSPGPGQDKVTITGSGPLDLFGLGAGINLNIDTSDCTYSFGAMGFLNTVTKGANCDGSVSESPLQLLLGGAGSGTLPAFGEILSGTSSYTVGEGGPTPETITVSWNIEPVFDRVPPKFDALPTGGPLGCNPTDIEIPNDFTILDSVSASAASGHFEIEAKHVDVTNGCQVTRTFTLTARDKCFETEAHAMVVYWWKYDKEPPVILGLPDGGNLGSNPANPPDDAAIKSQARPVDNCIECEPDVQVSHIDHLSGSAVTRVFTVTATDCCGNIAKKTVTFSWKGGTPPHDPGPPLGGALLGYFDINPGETTNTFVINLSASPTNASIALGGGVFSAGSFRTVVAIANSSYAFRDWTENGVVVSSSPAYSFTLDRNRELVANFVEGSYAATKTSYTGLFYEPEGAVQRSSGSFSLTTTTTGKFTAKFQLGAARYLASGQFDRTGQASATARSTSGTLAVALQVVENGSEISGTVSDGTWTASLVGDSAGFDGKTSIAPQAGQYTIVLAGEQTTAAEPGGCGYGTLTVDKAGRVSLRAVLADGTRITQAAAISADGIWAIYLPLYGGQGSLLSWIAFADSARDDLRGDVVWIKGANPSATYYPAGFATEMTALGSKFVRPAASGTTLGISNGSLMLAGGGLTTAITNRISIGPKDQVTNLETTKLNLVFNSGSGLFNGNFLNAQSSQPLSFSGVVLQKRNIAAGSFLGVGETGSVIVHADP
jgi:hypothetical protein